MIRVYSDSFRSEIDSAARSALRCLGIDPRDATVEFSCVSRETIRSYNRRTRGVDAPTDVLSYQMLENASLPFDKSRYPECVNPEDGSVIVGEVLLCEPVIAERASACGRPVAREMAFLACHGLLHLFGFDHATDAASDEMNAICERVATEAVGPGD